MPTAATVTFRDHADQELTLHLPAQGYPDGRDGVLLSLGRALDAYGGEECPALPGFDAPALAVACAGAWGRGAVILTAGAKARVAPPQWVYTVLPSAGAREAVYVRVHAPVEPARPGAPGGWVLAGAFLVFPAAVRPLARRLDKHGPPASLALSYLGHREAVRRAWEASPPVLGEVPHHALPAAADTLRRVSAPLAAADNPAWASVLVHRAAMAEARHRAGTAPGGPGRRRRA